MAEKKSVVLDQSCVYPSAGFPTVGEFEGKIFVGESLPDGVKNHPEEDVKAQYQQKKKAEWITEIGKLTKKIASGGATSRFVDFLSLNNLQEIINSLMLLEFLIENKIKTIISVQQASANELTEARMRDYQNGMDAVGLQLIQFPIDGNSTVSDTYKSEAGVMERLDKEVISVALKSIYDKRNVYIHCQKGQARAGQIAGALVAKLNKEIGKTPKPVDIATKLEAARTGTGKASEFFEAFVAHLDSDKNVPKSEWITFTHLGKDEKDVKREEGGFIFQIPLTDPNSKNTHTQGLKIPKGYVPKTNDDDGLDIPEGYYPMNDKSLEAFKQGKIVPEGYFPMD